MRGCRNPFHSSAHRFPVILGKPIANAGAPAPGMPTPGPDAEQQRIAQEQEAARTSHLFATTNVAQVAPAIPAPAGGQAVTPATGSADPMSQDHKLAFLKTCTRPLRPP
jgi:type IV secretion system protein VirB10